MKTSSSKLGAAVLCLAVSMPALALAQAQIDKEAAQRAGATTSGQFTQLLQGKLAAVRQGCQPHLDAKAHRDYAVCFNEGNQKVTEELFLEDGPLTQLNAELAASRVAQMERVDRGELTFDEATAALRIDMERIRARY